MLNSTSPTQPTVVSLANYSYLTTIGDKAIHFLQGQLSCDVNLLSTEQTVMGAYLNIQGRIITTLRLLRHNDQLLLQLPSNLSELVSQKLNRIAMLSRVKLQPSDDLQTIGIIGQHAGEQLQRYFTTIPTVPLQSIHEHGLTLIRITSNEQFMLIGSAESITAFAQQVRLSDGSFNDWLLQLIAAKLVEIDAFTSEQFTPHEIGLPEQGAVSFTKGCYVGQEIVARMQYLGKLKQHLQLLHWHTPPVCQRLDKVFNQDHKAVGQIAVIAQYHNQQSALVVLRDDHVGALLFTSQHEALNH
ncbi:MAG: YgfZ/GcvT domain-containing protein [Gammaproteobacteria bacterium]